MGCNVYVIGVVDAWRARFLDEKNFNYDVDYLCNVGWASCFDAD